MSQESTNCQPPNIYTPSDRRGCHVGLSVRHVVISKIGNACCFGKCMPSAYVGADADINVIGAAERDIGAGRLAHHAPLPAAGEIAVRQVRDPHLQCGG